MKKLSVIIPVLNEEQIIEKKLIELNSSLSNFLKQSEFEFIIINNGSKDKTEQILNDLLKKKIILGKYYNLNIPNYGLALREGLFKSKTKYIFICDIEQWDIPFFEWSWINRKESDIFIGSRRSDLNCIKQPRIRFILSWGLNALINFFFLYPGTDTHGPKLLNKNKLVNIIKSVKSGRGQYDTELVIRSFFKGFKIVEAPISHKELRQPKKSILYKIFWNLISFYFMKQNLKKLKISKQLNFRQYSRNDVLLKKKKLSF